MKYGLLFCAVLFFAQAGNAQLADTAKLIKENMAYNGAKAKKMEYKAIYQLDTDDPGTIHKTIRNINNLLNDPRLKNHVKVELVTYAQGTQALLKVNKQYEQPIRDLVNKGVIVAQCENSVHEQHRTKAEFFDFIGYTPSGNGELVIRAQEGWVIIKP